MSICFGRINPIATTGPFWSPAAAPSQAAKYALRWPRAKVTGIDVSATSIEQTELLKRKHRLDNLEVVQLPVERAAELGCNFDYVVCTGVLHHLSDPDKGLQALHDVLEPDGAMHRDGLCALTAEPGRICCRTIAAGSASAHRRKEIRISWRASKRCRPTIPLIPLLRNAPDFRAEAALADALLHPQDRAYSVPQLFNFLAAAGFGFGRWVRQAAYLPQCGALASHPAAFADPVASGTTVCRGGTLSRLDGAVIVPWRTATDRPNQRVNRFHWRRLAWLCAHSHGQHRSVFKRSFARRGAAVLINRSHTYTDIYLPINAQQKNLIRRRRRKTFHWRDCAGDCATQYRACAIRGALAVRPGRVRRITTFKVARLTVATHRRARPDSRRRHLIVLSG